MTPHQIALLKELRRIKSCSCYKYFAPPEVSNTFIAIL